MRIAIIAPGSRGDVQPYVAIGKGLQRAGHQVRVISNLNHETLVTSYGLEFRPVEVDVQEILQTGGMQEVLEKGGLITSMARMAGDMKRAAARLEERGLDACRDADLVLAGIAG